MDPVSANAPAVSVREVSVAIDDDALLAPTSLDVGGGEVVALRGPNGSGKTTLLRLVAGLSPAMSGEVLVCGESPRERDAAFRERVAALIGTPPLARNLTLREHLELVAASWPSLFGHAVSILDDFGIARLEHRFPHELSSGQQQLFALCLTFVRPFEVLLLDEPEQRLDAERRELLADVIARRAAAGTAVLMATHSAELVERTGARVVRLGDAEA